MSDEVLASTVEPTWRRVARLVIALSVGLGTALLGYAHEGRHLTGRVNVVGYPTYANFDVNRYFDTYYLAAIVLPLLAIVAYLLLARFGPLRRSVGPRRAARDVALQTPVADDASSLGGAVGRTLVVGAIGGLLLAATGLDPTLAFWGGLGGFVAVVLVAIGVGRAAKRPAGEVLGVANTLGCAALVVVVGRIAARAGVFVTSTGRTQHFDFFPLWLWFPATVAVLAVAALHLRRRGPLALDRPFVVFLAVPIGMLFVLSFIPGPLGTMDPFGEGEYLAAGYLMLHGAAPWRDILLIHGVLDDGFKGLIGFAIFGISRWGGTAGITLLLSPLYFVATYLFAATLFVRRWALVAASAVAVGFGVFVDWDVRYVPLPIVLISLTALLRRPTVVRGVTLGVLLVLVAVVVPELALAIPPVAGVVVAAEWYAAGRWRPRLGELHGTLSTLLGGASAGAVLVVYLVATHSVHGFVDYYKDFADAHSFTGGIPLFTNYAVAGTRDALGVQHFRTTPTGLWTRYSLELVLPVVAMLLVTWGVVAKTRGGRRLTPEDFVTVACAGVVLLYFQKAISRADTAHISEVFAVTTPLAIALVGSACAAIDRRLPAIVSRLGARVRPLARPARSLARAPSIASITALAVVLVLAPGSVSTVVRDASARFLPTSPTVGAASPIPGGPSLGYAAPGALPPGIVTNLERVFRAEAGAHGAVFDLSDDPGIVDFLLARNPGTRFYDISLALTAQSQRLVVADLAARRPPVVLFSGVVGLSYWDFLQNEVREYIVSQYVLDHYRPLVETSGELVMIADSITHPAPLPKLVGSPSTTQLYFSGGACDWGYVPNYLDVPPVPTTAVPVALKEIASRGKGRLYQLRLPPNHDAIQWLALDRTGAGPAAISLFNINRPSGIDYPWHDVKWVASNDDTTEVSVGSCLEWHGYGRTIYLRYLGRGAPTSVRLFNS